MSYTALDSIQWGGVPKIGVSFGYDSRRSGSTMQYRIYVTVAPLTGASYFGYPIYLSVTVDGGSVCSGHTLKAASPSRWSSAIEYDSGWVTAAGAVGTAPLGIRLYSGSGSARDDSYGYALPVERVEDIGDFSLTAGDAVMVMVDAISRLVPGVLHNNVSAEFESFQDNLLEYPQYSRPEEWHGKKVPPVLMSGHHANIEKWRREQSILRTYERRPDLLEKSNLTEKEKKWLKDQIND